MSKGRDFFLSFLYFLVDPIVSRAPVGSAAVTMGGHVPLSGSASSSPLKKLPGAGWLDHGAARGLPFREDTPVRIPPAGRGVPPSPHVSRCVGSAPPTGARVRLGPSSRTRGRRRLLSARTVGPGAPAAFKSASSAARAPPSWGRHPVSGVSRALRGRPSGWRPRRAGARAPTGPHEFGFAPCCFCKSAESGPRRTSGISPPEFPSRRFPVSAVGSGSHGTSAGLSRGAGEPSGSTLLPAAVRLVS